MTEGGRHQAVNVKVIVNAPAIQEGDSIRLENTETNINTPNIQQMNINQQENDAPENLDPVYDDDINQEAEAMNLSSSDPRSIRRRRCRVLASEESLNNDEQKKIDIPISVSKVEGTDEVAQNEEYEDTSDSNLEVGLIEGRTGTKENSERRKACKTPENRSDADGQLEQNQRRRQFCSSSRFIYIVSSLVVLLSALSYKIGHYRGHLLVQNEEYKHLQSELLKDKAVFFCAQSNFTKSDSLLKQLTSVPEQEVMSVPLALRTAECYANLGMHNKTEEAIKVTRELLTTSPYDANVVVDSAVDLIRRGHYFRAIVLLRIASTMYKSHESLSPNDIVDRIVYCVEYIFNAIIPTLHKYKADNISIEYATRYFIEIIYDIRDIKNADPSNRAKQEAFCIVLLQQIFVYRKQYKKIIKFSKEGVELLEQRLGHHNAHKHKVYGQLLHQIGFAYAHLKNQDEARLFFIQANDALTQALDFESEDEKQQHIDNAKNNLRIARSAGSNVTAIYFSTMQ